MLKHVSLNLECDMNALLVRRLDWYVVTTEMHTWDACNVTNVTCDRLKAALSEWEVIALNIQPEGRDVRGIQEQMPGQHMVTFGWASPPPLSWVGNEMSCCLVEHMSLHVTLDSLRAARDDLALISDTRPFHRAAKTTVRKLVDIEWRMCLLWLMGVMLGIHKWEKWAVQVYIPGNGQPTCTTGKKNVTSKFKPAQKKSKT